jgi:hypothetical protein
VLPEGSFGADRVATLGGREGAEIQPFGADLVDSSHGGGPDYLGCIGFGDSPEPRVSPVRAAPAMIL